VTDPADPPLTWPATNLGTAPAAAAAADPLAATEEWRRVSPKFVWVDLVTNVIPGLIAAAVMAGIWLFVERFWWLWIPAVAALVVTIIVAAFTPRRVRSIGYQLREDDLVFRRGIMWRRIVSVPYGRMQLVDVTRGPIARAVGLAELKFVTAAAATGVTIPGLPEAEAEELRDRLVALAESRRAGL